MALMATMATVRQDNSNRRDMLVLDNYGRVTCDVGGGSRATEEGGQSQEDDAPQTLCAGEKGAGEGKRPWVGKSRAES